MEIRFWPTAQPGPQGLEALGATAAPPPPEPEAANVLGPSVVVDVSPREARFVRDRDTAAMVFQIVDPVSQEVIAQLPSEAALRNRAYDSARALAAPGGSSRVA